MKKTTSFASDVSEFFADVDKYVQSINGSKLFAGLMIITLNIASRFVNLRLSKTLESYLKNTFSRDILVFAIAWMGTRDIYVALTIALIFAMLVHYFLNEESALCCLPESFRDYHLMLLDEMVTEDDVKKARETIAKYERQQMMTATSRTPPPSQSPNPLIKNP